MSPSDNFTANLPECLTDHSILGEVLADPTLSRWGSDEPTLVYSVKSINAGYKELTGKKENKKGETRNTDIQGNMDNKKEKRVVENGVILLPENSEENNMVNDICRRMKSGDADWDKINNDMELNNIKQIINDNIDISIRYIRSNLDFDNFNSSDLEHLREIINDATEKMNTLMKDMEELVNE